MRGKHFIWLANPLAPETSQLLSQLMVTKPKPRWGEVAPYYHSVQPDLGDRGYVKEFNNWILAQFPSGGGEPVMLALAPAAAQVPALGVARGWCPC